MSIVLLCLRGILMGYTLHTDNCSPEDIENCMIRREVSQIVADIKGLYSSLSIENECFNKQLLCALK